MLNKNHLAIVYKDRGRDHKIFIMRTDDADDFETIRIISNPVISPIITMKLPFTDDIGELTDNNLLIVKD